MADFTDKIKKAGMDVLRKVRKAVKPNIKKYQEGYDWRINPERGYLLLKKQKQIESPDSRARKFKKHPDSKMKVDQTTKRGKDITKGIAEDIENQTAKEKAVAYNRLFRKKPRKSGVDFK